MLILPLGDTARQSWAFNHDPAIFRLGECDVKNHVHIVSTDFVVSKFLYREPPAEHNAGPDRCFRLLDALASGKLPPLLATAANPLPRKAARPDRIGARRFVA